MFSMKRRWFFAIKTSLLKARGHRKGQKRFRPVAAGKRQNLAGCCRLPRECARAFELQQHDRAGRSCMAAVALISRARAGTAMHSAHSCYISCAQSALHLSTTAGIVLLSCLSTRCLCFNFIMLSLSPPPLLSLFTNPLYAAATNGW